MEEGLRGVFTGAGPTIVRAMALNLGMLASNEQAKESIMEAGYSKTVAVRLRNIPVHNFSFKLIKVILRWFYVD